MDVDTRYTIQTEAFSVKLSKTYQKIITLLPAPSKTFVFLALQAPNQDLLVHVDAQGTVLYEHKFAKQVDCARMITPDEVIVLEPKLNQITVFNLNTHSALEIPFIFMNEEYEQSTLFTFTNSKYLCVAESGRYNDNRFKLNYFATPLTKNAKPFHVYESDFEWNYQYLLRKGNEDSMILWFKARQDEEFEIKTYELKDNAVKGEFNHYRLKNEVGAAYNYHQEVQVALVNAWEVQPGSFCLVCNSEKTSLGLKNSVGSVNNNFIWNVNSNEIRQAGFWFDPKYNDFLIDIDCFGDFSIFRTYYFQNGKVESSPCYYVHNKTEKIAAVDMWECTYLIKFEYPGFERLVVESEYENSDVSSFKMRLKRVVQKQQ